MLRVLRALDAEVVEYVVVYGEDPTIEEISTADLLGEYPAVRYYPPSGDLYFDIMTRLGTAASYDSVKS